MTPKRLKKIEETLEELISGNNDCTTPSLAHIFKELNNRLAEDEIKMLQNLKGEIKKICEDFYWQKEELKARSEEFESYANLLIEQKQELDYKNSEIVEINKELSHEISKREEIENEKEQMYKRLIETSRQAGMSEIATGVLHNVGNMFNSINISTGIIIEAVDISKVQTLKEIVTLMVEHKSQIGEFLTENERGKLILPYLQKASEELITTYNTMLTEIHSLEDKVTQINRIITIQQKASKKIDVIEEVSLDTIIDKAIQINEMGFTRHNVELIKNFYSSIKLKVDSTKLLQVLINILSNAKYALDDVDHEEKTITIESKLCDNNIIEIIIEDNGKGIEEDLLAKIFQYGFTTRENGHGFGLHTCALHMKELGGKLEAFSDGPGKGSKFIISIPSNIDSQIITPPS